MSALSCCLAWFVLGLLLGWLLGWWLDCWKRCKSKKASHDSSGASSSTSSVNSLVATPAEKAEVKVTPVATAAPPAPAASATPKVAPVPEDTSWMAVPALAALAKAAKKGGRDNLEIVEGIGPKIAGLLNDADIKTFAQLADTPVATISKILEAAGSRYRLAKPDTWPQQAGLAASGKWAALKELQDKLSGGVKAKKG